MKKTTLVLGVSPNPERYSNRAVRSLKRNNIPVIAIGRRDYDSGDLKILRSVPADADPVHTLALYMNATNQKEYYDFILSVHPQRIIFNPGTWNPELALMAKKEGIEVVDDCLLAMLSCGHF